jgi:hypothetical protein
MIGPDQVVNGVMVGLICLFLGFVPGLLNTLTEGLETAAALLFWRFAPPRPRSRGFEPTPGWFAAAGIGMIVLTFAAYYVR